MPKVGIVYAHGSARPAEIVLAGRRLCEPVFIVNGRSPGIPGHFCDVTDLEPDAAARKIMDLGVEGITTFSDPQVIRTAEIAAAGGMPYHSVDTARACRDKFLQRKILADAGVGIVRSQLVNDPADLPEAVAEVGLPVVVKPQYGMGSIDTVRLDSAAEVRTWVDEHENMPRNTITQGYVVEELLVGDPAIAGPEWGDYVGIASVVENSVVRDVCLMGRFPLSPPFREAGIFVPPTVGSSVEQSCFDLAAAAVLALGIENSVTDGEIKLTADGPRIIEINGRPAGYLSEMLRAWSGFDPTRAALKLALGQPVGEIPPLPDGVVYKRFVQVPQYATKLVAVNEPSAAEAIESVIRYDAYRGPGDTIDWREGTGSHIGVVYGQAADHERAMADTDAAIEALAISYE
ncbi:hypothetical protein OG943_24785 [Amycolatopsis sp. NBC_00345]|uniref:hypothetical protein n=1 Tax=Amycolatopsis sp. NBC_00345 TaxID=2975955 RepID=UPI002E25A097